MPDRLAELERRLAGVVLELKEVRARLDRLEGRPSAPSREPTPAGVPAGPPAPAGPTGSWLAEGVIGLLGRTLMALGGAYLLRAVTEAGAISPLTGALAGVVYCVWWLTLADRAAASGQRLSAIFHGTATALIAYPLIWEMTTRFRLLGHAAAVGAILAALALGLALAGRRGLMEMAWVHGLLALGTMFSLLQATHALATFATGLLLLAAFIELTATRDLWLGLRWPVALGLDLAVLQMVLIAVRPGGPPPGYPPLPTPAVILVGLALPVLYLGSIAIRTLVRSRAVRPFEVLQAVVAMLVGFGGTLRVVEFTGVATAAVGTFALLLGAACYAVAFAFIERRSGTARNFYVYTTFAGLLTLAGARLMLSPAPRALLWAGLGLGAAWLGGRFVRNTLRVHGLLYLGMAAGTAGIMGAAADGLFAGVAGPWRAITWVGLVVAVVTLTSYIALATTSRSGLDWQALLPQTGVAAVVAVIVGGLAVRALAGTLARAPGAEAEAGVVATLRTAVLAALALLLAWAGRRFDRAEIVWLVYPILAVGGLRLLLEDLPHGRPLTLFVSFALYGGALFATPRLLRRP